MAVKDDAAAWTIVGYLLAGLLFWGGAGLLVDHFLGTHIIYLFGMLIGLGAALYLVWARLIRE